MINLEKNNLYLKKLIQHQINFLFISFIFLSGLKYEFFQFRFLILILLLPCGLSIIEECLNKDFKNTKVFFYFSLILITHSFLNIYFENNNITKYNLSGIIFTISIFIISLYFHENFNKNILNILKFFFLLFFGSVILSLLNFKNDAPFFCGGIPDIFATLKSFEQYLPKQILESLNNFDLNRINEIKFSFKEYLFPENSHLGMIAPSIIIYLLHISFTENVSKLFKFIIYLFILVCLIKSSTTLLVGTTLSLIILIFFNFKIISTKTLFAYGFIIISFSLILISSEECRKRFVPIYQTQITDSISKNQKEIQTIGEISPKMAFKLKNILGTGGSLSSGVYFHALMIAKKSIIEKPFGWGVNRYDKAFEFINTKKPPKIDVLKTYNNKDGTNNFVKLIVEFGIFGLMIYLFFFLFLVSKKIPLEYKLFYMPFVVTQSLRGAGYFNSGFSLIIFFMLFTYLKLNKKR